MSNTRWEDARDQLRKMREDQVRDGPLVMDLWENTLCDHIHKLGDEMWVVQEQVAIAALDCGRLDIAEECREKLNANFPRSNRVKRLTGMLLEAEGEYEEAFNLYSEILKDDPTYTMARKRQIAICKEQNNIEKAIEMLNDYLKTFMTDFDAWMELCDLYLCKQEYPKACFCMEELIMSNPQNHLFHQKYAEIKYTQGGIENMESARAYFAQAAKLNPNSMRAQLGLLLSSIALSKKDPNNSKYAAWAAQQITDKYQTQETKEQIKETKVLESIQNMLAMLTSGN
ncbi:hypothetical protein ACJMK2_002116 [Sinanodonta woodiana]|uniref:ER membrane protein complex subunit 2 n=1 Tax=Sinanodonta woodiana TaxID=1069815 RepID=A0ABD3XWL7_SINWO